MKAKTKKGTVKCVDRNSLKVVLLGPVGEKGYYNEKKVNLHCIRYYDEPFRNQAFEFLRKELVGQKVEFVDYKIGKDVNADLFLNGKNVAFTLVSKGLAKPSKSSEKPSKYFEDLPIAEKQAQENKEGAHGVGDSDDEGEVGKLNRKQKRALMNKQKQNEHGDAPKGELTGYVDNVDFSLNFEIWVDQMNKTVLSRFASVKTPIISKEHVIKLKNWMSKNIYQRDFKFKILGSEEQVQLVAETESGIVSSLLREGWAKLDSEAATNLPGEIFSNLRDAQEEAQEKRLRLWKEWKKKDKGKQIKSNEWPIKKKIEVKVLEVHNGDCVTVQEKGGNTLRIYLTNVSCPKYNWQLAEKNPEWAFEAKEFTRSALAKKKVTLEMDVRKIITKGEAEKKEIEINAGTIYLGEKPFAYDLIHKGLADLKIVKGSEDVSSAIKAYSLAYEKAKKAKNGIHGNKYVRKAYWDYSIPENKKKLASESNVEKGETDLPAVVEKCISATRFKIRLESKSCYVIFAIDTVTGVRSNKNMNSFEKWAKLGTEKATELLAQRDVTVDILKIDKAGTCHGALFFQKKNYGKKILMEGLAYVDANFGRNMYYDSYMESQNKAKQNKKGIWSDDAVLGGLGLVQEEENKEEKTNNVKEYKAELSECESAVEFFIKRNDNNEMNSILKTIKEKVSSCSTLSEPIELNTLCLATFDGEYHRARILSRVGKTKYKVFYIDWGNYGTLSAFDLKICPKKIMNVRAQAKCVKLAHVRVPNPNQNFGLKAIDLIQEKLYDKTFYVTQLSSSKGLANVEIYLNSKKEFSSSLNYVMCKLGLAIPDLDDKDVERDNQWRKAYDEAMDANPELLRVLDEEYE